VSTEPAAEETVKVTTLELFFDLVFVFTITQLTSVLAHEATFRGLLRVVLMLGVIWWMYGGYVWLTNAVAPDRPERRALLFGGMAAFLVVALAIPRAFDSGGAAFGLAYITVVVVHLGLFAKSTSATTLQAVAGLAPFNLVTAGLVLAGGLAGGSAQYALWTVAFALEWVTPRLIQDGGFEIAPGHFVERHGLVILIAIGESVVAVGAGAAHAPLDLELAAVATLGFALSAGLWWVYFGGGDVRAETALANTPLADRPRLAIDAFGYWHLLLLLGIIAIAAGERDVVADPGAALANGLAAGLGGGTAAYLLGHALFRRSLRTGPFNWRLGGAALALVSIPLGALAGVLQFAALAALLLAVAAVE
jgi:low temperature requirement protein LtrA